MAISRVFSDVGRDIPILKLQRTLHVVTYEELNMLREVTGINR